MTPYAFTICRIHEPFQSDIRRGDRILEGTYDARRRHRGKPMRSIISRTTLTTGVTRPYGLSRAVADTLAIRKADSVPYLTLFRRGFASLMVFSFASCVADRAAWPSVARSPALWGVLAATATVTVVLEGLSRQPQVPALLLVMGNVHRALPMSAFRERIIQFNARFFLIFIFLGRRRKSSLTRTCRGRCLKWSCYWTAFMPLRNYGIDNA